MAKAYSYIRMSTPEQLKGDSVRRQQQATNDYIQENGLELADIIRDHGVSAFKGKNVEFGALSEFLELAENGQIEAGSFLIVESLDRLTRQNVFDAISLLNRIIRFDVNVVTLTDKRVYSRSSIEQNASDLMIASITMMRAHEESLTKSLRLSAAWQQKRKSAREGHITKQRIPLWLRFSSDGKHIEVIERRAEIIREIFQLSRDGWGAYSIAKEFNRRGTDTWGRSSMWQESYIKKLLHSRSLLGEYHPHLVTSHSYLKKRTPDGKPILGYYPPVVDEVLFEEANESIAKRRGSGAGRKGANYPNLFTGTLKCGYCGSGIRFMDKGALPKGGQYLRCSKSLLTRNCGAVSMRYDVVEKLLLTLVRDVNLDTAVNGPKWHANLNNLKSSKIQNEKIIVELSAKIHRIVDAIADMPEITDLQVKLRSLTEERQSLVASSAKIDTEIADLSMTSAEDRDELLRRLEDASLDRHQRVLLRKNINAEIRRFVRSITLSPKQLLAHENENSAKEFQTGVSVEVGIKYRNGSWQKFSKTDETDIYGRADKRQKLLHEKSIIDRLE